MAIAKHLLEAGADVTVLDVNLEALTDEPRLHGVHVDLTQTDAVSAAMNDAAAAGLDIVVHAAGVHCIKPLAEITEDDWDALQNVNMKSAFFTARDAIGLMGGSADGVTFTADDAGLLVTTADGQNMWLSGLGTGDAGKIIFHTLGTDGSNTLLGHDGGDRIFAHGGDDRIDSGAGTDRITTGEGADTILFGTGYGLNVVYDFDLTEDSIELTDLLGSDLTFLQYKHTDLEIKTEAGDRLVLRNIDLADAGLVTIIDAPTTHGVLMGTEGRDTLQGTALDELFIPLGDTDRLYGGLGSDVFDFREGYDLNVIYDFEDGIDRILIDAAVFDTLTILAYKDTDAEIRLASGDRLVLRDVDFNAIDADDFIFDLPEAFA